ncbi:MAG: metallophosphoesterase family protein [Bacteroidota bacterium]
MPIKILATGDIHIGRKSTGVPDNPDEISTKHTWNRLVERAIRENFDALALTGDIVDQDNRFFEAVGPLQAGFEHLKEANIDVFIVAGNHDYDVLNQVADGSKFDNIQLLGANGKWETIPFRANNMEMKFVGWSFPGKHFYSDPLAELDVPASEVPVIGLLHAELDTPESWYAPVNRDQLRNHPVDAWMLGHIHKPDIIRKQDPVIAYPGSPHALSPKEQGKHGPLQITITSKNDIRVESLPMSPVRYETTQIDVSGDEDKDQLRKLVVDHINQYKADHGNELENVRFLVLDLYLTGEHPHSQDIESWMTQITEDLRLEGSRDAATSVRKVEYNIRPAVKDMAELAKEPSPAGLIAETILAIENGTSTPLLETLLQKWKSGVERINNAPTYFPLKNENILPDTTDEWGKQEILGECKRILGELINQKDQ